MYFRIKDDAVYDYSDINFDKACVYSDLCTKAEYDEHPNKYMIGDVEEQVKVYEYEKKTITVIDYDDEGNPIGEHTEKVDDLDKPIMIKEVDPETGETILVHKFHYETIIVKGLVINPDYEQEEAEREKERIGNLQITKRVFMLGLQQLGITYTQLKTLIATNEQAQMEWDLCVELQRKNPLLDIMAAQLEVSSAMLDYIFRKANGEDLQPPEEA